MEKPDPVPSEIDPIPAEPTRSDPPPAEPTQDPTPSAEDPPNLSPEDPPATDTPSAENENPESTPETLPIETPDVPEEMPTLTPPTPQPDSDSTPVVSDPINVDDGAKENDIEEIGKFEMTNNPLDPENKKGYYMDMEISDSENPEVEESGKVANETVVTLDTEGDLEKEQVDLYYQETDGEKGTEVEAASRDPNDRRPSRTMYEELEEKSRILDESLQRRKKVEEPAPKDIKQCLTVSKKIILFGAVIPGQIKEQRLLIENFSTELLTLRVRVDCCNQEFDELDEYVLSIRKPPQYDYNDTYFVMMNEKDYITFHVAIKVPKLKQACEILGKITITAQGLLGKYEVYLSSDAKIPLIYCPKMLMVHEIGMEVVPFTQKSLKRQDFKLPVKSKSNGNLNLSCEFEFLDDETGDELFSFAVQPTVINFNPFVPQTLGIIARATNKFMPMNFSGQGEIRKVLIARIKNSSMIFSFPIVFKANHSKRSLVEAMQWAVKNRLSVRGVTEMVNLTLDNIQLSRKYVSGQVRDI